MFDLAITGGTIVDGTGRAPFRGEIGVRDGRISEVGEGLLTSAPADAVIDALGLVVSPGFIDVHSHSDLTLLMDPHAHSKLMQGVTTEVNGNCGFTAAPIQKTGLSDFVEFWKSSGLEWFGIEPDWEGFGEYLRRLENGRPSLNAALLAGHGTIRFAAMGTEPRRATDEEMSKMERLLEDCLREGASGLSSGLRYVPGCYADVRELVALCRVVGRFGGLYATHMRSEGDNGSWEESVEEAAAVARQSGVPLEISHLKALSKNVWNTSDRILKLCESFRAEGLELNADQYPYDAAHTGLTVFLPTWVALDELGQLSEERRAKVVDHIGKVLDVRGGPERIIVISSPDHGLNGKDIAEVSAVMGLDPAEAILQLIVVHRGEISIISRSMIEEDIQRIMRARFVMFSTDGYSINPNGPAAVGIPHPRSYGTYPRVLGRYVRELGLLSLEEAVRKMTSLPARKFQLKDRGVIREGAWADLVVFDPAEVEDLSTYSSPATFPKGIYYVTVNGRVTVSKGKIHTGQRAGRVLRLKDGVVS
jgi:N-acyl-D-amino-acid deacylase